MGILINENGYEFLRFGTEGWESLSQYRLLQPVELDDGFLVQFTPGESVWHETLNQDTLLEELFEDPKEALKPHLYIWSSGDLTPGEIRFTIKLADSGLRLSSNTPSFTVQVEETGQVELVEAGQS